MTHRSTRLFLIVASFHADDADRWEWHLGGVALTVQDRSSGDINPMAGETLDFLSASETFPEKQEETMLIRSRAFI